MNNIQFLKGEYKNLSKVPLTPGAILFTEDTRRLFIDTDTARLPVSADQVAGKIFWIQLLQENWGEDFTQTVEIYYDEKNSSAHNLNELISEDSIMFLGKISYEDGTTTGIKPAVVSQEVTKNSITFRCYNIDPNAVQPPIQNLWIQLYCPNPIVSSLESVDVFRTVFTARMEIPGNGWVYKEDARNYIYTIHVPNIDFSKFPFFANLSDDSLENRKEFQKMKVETNGEDIEFITIDPIFFNINIDICIFLGPGAVNGEIQDLNRKTASEIDWAVVTLDKNTSINERKATARNIGIIRHPQDGGDRKFLVFCITNANEDFAHLEDITYTEINNQGNIEFIFKEGYNELKVGFSCVIIQLNNIAKIISEDENGEPIKLLGVRNMSPGDNIYNGWMRTDSNLQYYGSIPEEYKTNRSTTLYTQYWPRATDKSNTLSGKFFPIVMPKNIKDVGRFSEICETKLYSNRIQFFIKSKYLNNFAVSPAAYEYDKSKDLEIVIIDFI